MTGNDSNLIPDRIIARELLRHAVQRQIFSPYGGGLLDVRRAVLIDGTDHGGKMIIMTAVEYDAVLESVGGVDALAHALSWNFAVYDGRILFGKKPKKPAEMNGPELIAQAFDGVEF